jgi:murein endopeptidase
MKIYLESRTNRLLKDSVSVVERVAELILLPESQNYVKAGGTCNHHGPRTDSEHLNCRTQDHNHRIHPEAADSLARAAGEFLNAPWNTRRERMRINDASLPYGGLFDINGNWRTPHASHRNGKDVDIENSARLQRLREVLEGRRWTYIPEGPNFFPHFRFQ